MTQGVDIIRIRQGEPIFTQGEAADAAYLLEAGSVSIRQSVDGRVLDLDTVRPGEIFGEMALLGGGRRMATATAAEDSVVARLGTAGFAQRLDGADRFLRALVLMVVKNIRTSHRVFLRRPRSFSDHVRQMTALSANLRRFARRQADQGPANPDLANPDMADPDLAHSLARAVDTLDGALADLARLAAQCRDQRHDIILDTAEADGVGLDQVVGSESRRRVYAPARPSAAEAGEGRDTAPPSL